jgi:DNA-binding NarL/FixJ family response regulator
MGSGREQATISAVSATVVIVDDHPSFRASARLLLESEGYEVVGEAADGAAALDMIRELSPDWVLLDVQLPDIDGCEVAARLGADGGGPAIVLTSSRAASDLGACIRDSGARGFIPKDELSGATLAEMLP